MFAYTDREWGCWPWASALLVLSLVSISALANDKTDGKKKEANLPTGLISAEAWRSASTAPLAPGEIDRLLDAELKKADIKPAPRTTDELFLRRVMLDLTGKLPEPADIADFANSKDPERRAKIIDKLLASDDFARHWAGYWREVIASRATEQRARGLARYFENWLTEQFKKNVSWADIARAMITANGELRFFGQTSDNAPPPDGPSYFLLSRTGADAINERTAETSRVFLGIQIQCAQCHDHPSDVWKRKNFHELAAYFARVRDRPVFEEKRLVGLKLTSLPFGEHKMPGLDDPKKGTTMSPRFLDGKTPSGRVSSDEARRRALADAITSKDNPWFAAAFVNRIWGELLGQSFYMPVDDMGPQKEAVFPTILPRLAGSFRGSNYDIKALFRAIMNSEAYQRQIRLGESTDEHLLFAATYPTRMQGSAIWNALINALGPIDTGRGFFGKGPGAGGPFRGAFSLKGQVEQEFNYDPSTRPEEVESSISQALLLMNNPAINSKIKAAGTNLLARVLKTYSSDGEALRMVYLRTLARRPTDREMSRCLEYIARVQNRAEAFEDILWVLINSTEFQTKR